MDCWAQILQHLSFLAGVFLVGFALLLVLGLVIGLFA